MFKVADITITSLDVITGYSMAGDPMFILDELQDATISNTQETEDITGKGGRLLSRLKRNKAVTISGTNGLISGGLLEAQTGSEFDTSTLNQRLIPWSESLVITNHDDGVTAPDIKAYTTYQGMGTYGAEIEALYVKDNNGIASTKMTQVAADPDTGEFTYDKVSRKLKFSEDDTSALPDGTEIVVFYTRAVDGVVLHNESDVYSQKCRLVVDATGEDKCSNIYHVQIEIPKADFSGDFDLALGDSQTTHAFEATSLVSTGCSASSKGYLWTYTVFGVTA